MSFPIHTIAAKAATRLLCLFALLAPSVAARAQSSADPYIGRFDLYTGFGDLYTPGLNDINQPGFHLQAGTNLKPWLAGGFDYTVITGDTHLTANIATTALQQQLAAELPPGYVLSIPLTATIQTFTAGGQFVYRGLGPSTTLFLRPGATAFHIRATPHPNDVIGTVVAGQLAPQGYLTDWYGAYGAGGGAEFRVVRHLGARVQFDAAWNHPFTNILGKGNWSYRFSIGPAFHFGRNIAKP